VPLVSPFSLLQQASCCCLPPPLGGGGRAVNKINPSAVAVGQVRRSRALRCHSNPKGQTPRRSGNVARHSPLNLWQGNARFAAHGGTIQRSSSGAPRIASFFSVRPDHPRTPLVSLSQRLGDCPKNSHQNSLTRPRWCGILCTVGWMPECASVESRIGAYRPCAKRVCGRLYAEDALLLRWSRLHQYPCKTEINAPRAHFLRILP